MVNDKRKTLKRWYVPGTKIVHYDGGAKAKAHHQRMMGVHARRLAKRKAHQAQLPALRARARVKIPKLMSSMVGSPHNKKYGVYLSGGRLQRFFTRKARRDFINESPQQILWQWSSHSTSVMPKRERLSPMQRWLRGYR